MILALLLGWTVMSADSLPAATTKVLWTPQTYEVMRFLYERISLAEDGVEFAACLRATRRAGAWIVTEVIIPAQTGNSSYGIAQAGCPPDYQGVAHSHPLWRSGGNAPPLGERERNCYPSAEDFASFRASPHAFMVLWCDSDSFAYRTRDGGIGGKDIEANRSRARGRREPYIVNP